MSVIQINFNNSTYNAGGVVAGEVVVELYTERRVRGGEFYISPGKHVFPFQCSLPSNIPSSFEGKYGSIRYSAEAVLNRPRWFDDQTEQYFTVISPLDLNNEELAKSPINLHQEDTNGICCCCCCCYRGSGPLSASVQAPASGFALNQKIPLLIKVENESKSDVSEVECYILQETRYIAQSPGRKTKTWSLKVQEIHFNGVRAHHKNYWNVEILVPSNLAILKYCRNIQANYSLIVRVNVRGIWLCDLHFRAPLVVGTVPLQILQNEKGSSYLKQTTINEALLTGASVDMPPHISRFSSQKKPPGKPFPQQQGH